MSELIRDLEITCTSTERQKRSQNLAPVLVIISGNSLVFLGKCLPVLVFTGAAPLGTYVLHPGFSWFSSRALISANPAIKALSCGCLSCLRQFRDSPCEQPGASRTEPSSCDVCPSGPTGASGLPGAPTQEDNETTSLVVTVPDRPGPLGKRPPLSFFSLVFLFPWCVSCWGFPWFF